MRSRLASVAAVCVLTFACRRSAVEVWKKRDGKWPIVRDIWNSSNKLLPPPEAPAPKS
ncbi:MAG TPA: hypothetical protein VJ826_06455 [Candidatus Polarisedimenticolaceae bacterium]|nr:hypothetical protein [Candidatus Polarisedimenticolaceae bacterium]